MSKFYVAILAAVMTLLSSTAAAHSGSHELTLGLNLHFLVEHGLLLALTAAAIVTSIAVQRFSSRASRDQKSVNQEPK